MKIKAAPATGCPVPQFVVYAETEEDRMLMRAFTSFPDYARESWEFRLHGPTFGDGDIQAFNFGWAKKQP